MGWVPGADLSATLAALCLPAPAAQPQLRGRFHVTLDSLTRTASILGASCLKALTDVGEAQKHEGVNTPRVDCQLVWSESPHRSPSLRGRCQEAPTHFSGAPFTEHMPRST